MPPRLRCAAAGALLILCVLLAWLLNAFLDLRGFGFERFMIISSFEIY